MLYICRRTRIPTRATYVHTCTPSQEGTPFTLVLRFYVQHEPVLGLKYINTVKKAFVTLSRETVCMHARISAQALWIDERLFC